jgi:importin subunit beta-1
LQLDYESIDYIANLREGILEAHTGIVTGFKKTDRGAHTFLSF